MHAPKLNPKQPARALLAAAFFGAAACGAAPALADRTSVSVSVGVEIETRGPVHEAFAEPVVFDDDPGMVVAEAPPPPIDEIPPEERPEGDAVTWIPGYWSYDDDRRDFLWVSGVWRSIPPGRQFVPGYWARTSGGHQWVAGSWLAASSSQTLEYLPPPPAPLSIEPPTPALASDDIWVPGLWLWRHDTYVWRPGYWLHPNVDWVWVPAHYAWTPSGYLYCSGYWDYTVRRRGVLFAPAYIQRTVWSRPSFVYSPTVVIDSDGLVDCLFVRPRSRHYYFGDYYAVEYQRAGIVPVYTFHRERHGYSPLFAYTLSVHVRTDPKWERGYIRRYEVCRDRPEVRPPRTWSAYERARNDRRSGQDAVRTASLAYARPLSEVSRGRDTRSASLRFQRVAPEQRTDYQRGGTQLREYQTQRRELEQSWATRGPLRREASREAARPSGDRSRSGSPREARGSRGTPAPRDTGSSGSKESARALRLNLPRSPVASGSARETERGASAPPARPSTPRADPNTRSAPRVRRSDRGR